jgi:Flp pilus assembly pilin Flp
MQSPIAVGTLLRLVTRVLPRTEEGQDLLEYALLCGLIALVAVGAITTVGQTIYNVFWKGIAASI